MKTNRTIPESILDMPQEDLCSSLWVETDGSYSLADEASAKLQKLVDFIIQRFKMKNVVVHLTGSLMSNSYSSSSDIDVHFCSDLVVEDKVDELNRQMRKAFQEYQQSNPDDSSVDGHPFEVYFQVNPDQDLMSVGCYDFTHKIWLVGPEKTDLEFDPYAEYFDKDMKKMDDIIDQMREMILKTYEYSLVILKSKDQDFKEKIENKLVSTMKSSLKLFTSLRMHRKAKSSPKSREEAVKLRSSMDWKIADSAFKLMDKFGYIGQLKTVSSCMERIQSGQIVPIQAAQEIAQKFSDNISTQKILDSEDLDESLRSMLSMQAIAFILAIPGLMPVETLASKLENAKIQCQMQNTSFKLNSDQVKKAMRDSMEKMRSYHGLSYQNTINAVAMVGWLEARGEKLDGIKGVLSAISNRTGPDRAYIPDVLKQPAQFECLKNYTGGWTDKDYKYFVPYEEILDNNSNKMLWDQIQVLAKQVVDGTFKSTIGNRNSYMNKKTAAKKAVESWGKKLDLKIGNHEFGYLPEYNGNIMVPGTMTTRKQFAKKNSKLKKNKQIEVVVKSGDSLWKIAKANKTTIDKILKDNPDINDPNNLKIGQKIKV